MLNHNPFPCQTPIALFFSLRQSMLFGFLEGCLAVFMKFRQSLIASICQNAQMFRELTGIVFEHLEVVFAAMTKGGGYDLGTFSISHHLRFLGVPLLFAAVMPFLAFFGRSTGCSLTSTSTTSNTMSLAWSAFLPGRRNFFERTKTSSTLRMVHKRLLHSHHRIVQYEIRFDIRASTSKSSTTDRLGSVLAVSRSLAALSQ